MVGAGLRELEKLCVMELVHASSGEVFARTEGSPGIVPKQQKCDTGNS